MDAKGRILRLLLELEDSVNHASYVLGINTPSEIAGEKLDALSTAECAPRLIRELSRLAEHVQNMPPGEPRNGGGVSEENR